jgi:hypothetical protein
MSPEANLIRWAKFRATKQGIPFDLVKEDIKIPKECPVLHIPLVVGVRKSHANSPSLDRIVPSLGYVKGNIHVISHRANQIKSNATPEELIAVALFFSHLTKE